jgi:peroxiredoxin Q/BCP
MVIGISGDKVDNLKYFKEAHNLNFPLLADPDGSIARKFGVQTKEGGSIVRNIGGTDITLERGITESRWTFIIDKKGNIVYKNTEVNAAEDSKQTLEVIKNLK